MRMRKRNLGTLICNYNTFRQDKFIIFKIFIKKISFCIIIISIIFSVSLLLLPMPKDIEAQKAESEIKQEIEQEMCISYNKSENIITITCKSADFADVAREITSPEILKLESKAIATT